MSLSGARISTPKDFDYPRRNRQEKGIMLHYLRHTSADVALLAEVGRAFEEYLRCGRGACLQAGLGRW